VIWCALLLLLLLLLLLRPTACASALLRSSLAQSNVIRVCVLKGMARAWGSVQLAAVSAAPNCRWEHRVPTMWNLAPGAPPRRQSFFWIPPRWRRPEPMAWPVGLRSDPLFLRAVNYGAPCIPTSERPQEAAPLDHPRFASSPLWRRPHNLGVDRLVGPSEAKKVPGLVSFFGDLFVVFLNFPHQETPRNVIRQKKTRKN
jgi:hypothetical protein